ncbi:sperm-associated antigen 8-like isoform X1 [Mytilus galloprovincialis]|uniref:Sperm-associated antigen 8 n=1 Tax=Mytilus galloprovincialis TaxID=29158 RepID=A0A8B6HUQ2_MYTGA|nr:Hypothetical predicted protein [Mytilus galloprovincialis]
MSILNQGRNEIRFNNADGKCLLENWVEERSVNPYDCVEEDVKVTSSAERFKDGHIGILTTELEAPASKLTTVRESYKKPEPCGVRLMGKKEQMMREMFFEKVGREVFNEELEASQPEPTDFRSVTNKDFNIEGFKSVRPQPTKNHNYKKDQPVTYWSEHKKNVHGVSSEKTGDTPFRKNDAFSKPIGEYWDETQPYELENYPKM